MGFNLYLNLDTELYRQWRPNVIYVELGRVALGKPREYTFYTNTHTQIELQTIFRFNNHNKTARYYTKIISLHIDFYSYNKHCHW